MKQETMYPTQDQVIDAIRRWQVTSAPDFELKSVHLMGDSLRTFSLTFSNGTLGLRMSLKIMPGHSTEGWFATESHLFNLDERVTWEDNLRPYPVHLRDLMRYYPHNAIVSIDNEDEAYPVGHPVFGYAVIDDRKRIIAFAQHPRTPWDETDDTDYTFNPFLPHGEIVTDENVMETLTDTESPRIRGEWVDDEKEWWA